VLAVGARPTCNTDFTDWREEMTSVMAFGREVKLEDFSPAARDKLAVLGLQFLLREKVRVRVTAEMRKRAALHFGIDPSSLTRQDIICWRSIFQGDVIALYHEATDELLTAIREGKNV
jgi:hypothetical protein